MEEPSHSVYRLIEDEYFDYVLLKEILKREKDRKVRRILEELMNKEKRDLDLLKEYSPKRTPHLNRLKLWFHVLLYKLFGVAFIVKYTERNEEEILREYRGLLERSSGKRRKRLARLIRSTRRYEYLLRNGIKDARIKYVSFVALGLIDALISLIGTQSGFLGAESSSLIIAVATLIVGLATTVSMGAATYVQARELKNEVDPVRAALASMLTYLAVTAILALPYFFLPSLIAFAMSSMATLLLLLIYVYYTSVVRNQSFRERLTQYLFIVSGAVILTYFVGSLLESLTGVRL